LLPYMQLQIALNLRFPPLQSRLFRFREYI
jgi:hypothetical protein